MTLNQSNPAQTTPSSPEVCGFVDTVACVCKRCLLHLLFCASGSTCSSNVYVLLQYGRALFLVRSQCGPNRFFGCTRCRSSSRYRLKDNGVALLLGTLDVITHMVMQVGAFFSHSKNKCARDLLEQFVILFLDFVACP